MVAVSAILLGAFCFAQPHLRLLLVRQGSVWVVCTVACLDSARYGPLWSALLPFGCPLCLVECTQRHRPWRCQ